MTTTTADDAGDRQQMPATGHFKCAKIPLDSALLVPKFAIPKFSLLGASRYIRVLALRPPYRPVEIQKKRVRLTHELTWLRATLTGELVIDNYR